MSLHQMTMTEARSRIKPVSTKLLQTAYRGLVRLQDKRLSSGSSNFRPELGGCGCILTVAAIQHKNAGTRITKEAFHHELRAHRIFDVAEEISGRRMDAAHLWPVNDGFGMHSNNVSVQKNRYNFMLKVIKRELIARNALPVPNKAVH